MNKITKENYEQKIEVYNRIEKKLNQNNITFWQVLKYCAEERDDLYSPIHNVHVNWKRFKKTHTGISLERLKLYEEWTDEFIKNQPEKLWNELYFYVRSLTAENGIPLADIYSTWIMNHNQYASNTQISILDFESFRTSFYKRSYKSKYRFSYKRLKEIKIVLETMIYKTYDYEKKTFKRKYL